MKLRPLGNHVIVEPALKETKTASGIIIPDTAEKEQSDRGTVIAIGPGKLTDHGARQPIDLAVGAQVLFKKWGKEEVEIQEGGMKKKLLVVSADDLIAVIEN